MKNSEALYKASQLLQSKVALETGRFSDLNRILALWSWCLQQNTIEGLPSLKEANRTQDAFELLHQTMTAAGLPGIAEYLSIIDYNLSGKDIRELTQLWEEAHWSSANHFVDTLADVDLEKFGIRALPTRLGQFVAQILGNTTKSLLLQGTGSFAFMPHIKASKACLITESESASIYAQCIAMLGNGRILAGKDPLLSTEQADTVIAMPRIGDRLSAELASPFRSNLHDIASVEAVIKQARRQAVVFVSQRFLHSKAGGDLEIRKQLIQNNLLDAVVILPAGAHPLDAGIPLVMLVINHDRTKQASIQFMDASAIASGVDLRHAVRRHKDAEELFWQRLIKEWSDLDSSAVGRLITSKEIAANDYDLSALRYIQPESVRLLAEMTAKHTTVTLGDLVSITRAQNLQRSGEPSTGQLYIEVGSRDLDERGQIVLDDSDRTVEANKANMRLIERQKLQPGDVLIVDKGRVGQAALVTSDCPDNLVAGQVFAILRITDTKKIKPEYLFRYLASPLVQSYFVDVARGANVKVLRAEDLQDLPVPLLELPAQQAVVEQHQLIQQKHQQIEAIREEISQLASLENLL